MTPEKRAQALIEKINSRNGHRVSEITREAMCRMAAAVIRDTENDVLERAARRAEAFDQNVADAIRALKYRT